MRFSRRTLLGSAVAGTAAVVAGVSLDAFADDAPIAAVSSPGDVVGKLTVGYQGWFTARGDGGPMDGWWHYGQDWQKTPSPVNEALKSGPDVRDYDRVYKTGYPNLGNGQPASLFSSYDQQTVDTHFRWMQEYDLDTAALQRFNPVGGEGPIRDAVTVKVRNAPRRRPTRNRTASRSSGSGASASTTTTTRGAPRSASTSSPGSRHRVST